MLRRLSVAASGFLVLSAASCSDVSPGRGQGRAEPEDRKVLRCEDHILIELTSDGLCRVEGRERNPKELRVLLHARAEAAPRDADHLPLVSVGLRAHPECEFRHVKSARDQCLKEGIWRMWLGLLGDERLNPPVAGRAEAMKELAKSVREAAQ